MSFGKSHIKLLLRIAWVWVWLLAVTHSQAQMKSNICRVKDGKFYLEVQKSSTPAEIDYFVSKYDLHEIPIGMFLKGERLDSLQTLGWSIVRNDDRSLIISKPIESLAYIEDPIERQVLADLIASSLMENGAIPGKANGFGVNYYSRRHDFHVQDSVVHFFLRGRQKAREVLLAGSFTNWQYGAIKMKLTDSGWVAPVKLAPGKHWYKFIIDGEWLTDFDNPVMENDGKGNTNSVYYKTNASFLLKGYSSAKKVYVAGSFNDWRPRKLAMTKSDKGWQLPIYLPEGTHTYRFVVDDEWMVDPGNPDRFPNEFKDFNSVIRIGKPYLFKLDGYADARKVVLSGSFNNWREDELYMQKQDGGWVMPYCLGPGNYEYRFIVDDTWVSASSSHPRKNANQFFVIEPNYKFRLKGFANARDVAVSGDFNNWSPNSFSMVREGDEWVLSVHLEPGKHAYKFVVDGKWITDPDNPLWENNEHSTGNSILWFEPEGQGPFRPKSKPPICP